MIETLDDIIEELANLAGVYGACQCHDGTEGRGCNVRSCRPSFTSILRSRILAAVDIERRLYGGDGRSRAEIEAEIKALSPAAKDYDTERQSDDTCVATGAHDALRWALGLAEAPISENFAREG